MRLHFLTKVNNGGSLLGAHQQLSWERPRINDFDSLENVCQLINEDIDRIPVMLSFNPIADMLVIMGDELNDCILLAVSVSDVNDRFKKEMLLEHQMVDQGKHQYGI